MITRGYYIANIIDDLALISSQIKLRAGLNLTDLNIYLEDFCKWLLNEIYDLELENLNKERSNEPGLDLGDIKNKIAYQITSTKTLDKIKKTLAKSKDKGGIYESINILILQPKQDKYSLKNVKYAHQLKFKENNIKDFNDLCRDIIPLDLDKLEKIYKRVKKETAKVLIELEIQDIDGNYPTNLNKFIELKPTPKFQSADKLLAFILDINQNDEDFNEIDKVNKPIQKIIAELERLPRITRHMLGYIFQEAEWNDSGSALIMKLSKFQRQTTYPNFEHDFEMLEESGLFFYHEVEANKFNLKITLGNEYLALHIHEYCKENNIDTIDMFTNLNFAML
ncbi:SMEK domain-containing protein [Acinetobacter courvalinii]|uniref:SMEK domain-containing protein n=1 Tax=Acinetobacter courvalinii TaxID=280147 RepID=UPI0021D20341|nr:SMEK domain-containing protein [Acinetobacter courvalinii]MCU4578040.1 SMEK domain-containing protein [Acinetobacter courvalinii]